MKYILNKILNDKTKRQNKNLYIYHNMFMCVYTHIRDVSPCVCTKDMDMAR